MRLNDKTGCCSVLAKLSLERVLISPMVARAELAAGVKRGDVTPPLGEIMWGYGPRKNTGKLDPLFARVLVLGDGQTAAALVTLELGQTFGSIQMDAVRGRVRRLGVRPEGSS